jgi:hypothetical protein
MSDFYQEQSLGRAEPRKRWDHSRNGFLLVNSIVVAAVAFCFGLFAFEVGGHRSHHVELTQMTTLDPHASWLPSDDLAGIRPGQSLSEVQTIFKTAYWGNPYKTEVSSRSATVYSKPYVDELWDIDYGNGGTRVAYAHLTSPSSGNIVYSTTQVNEFDGTEGYPDFAAVQAALIDKYGTPSDRIQWDVHVDSGETLTLVWVRGGGSCDCQYFGKMRPQKGSAKALQNAGLPLAPVIVAEIQRMKGNRNKVGKLLLRLTDYSMIAKADEAEIVALEVAEAEYGKLSGPEVKF